MSGIWEDQLLRWFWAGFFAFYGAAVIALTGLRTKRIGSSLVARLHDETLVPRVRAILCKRGDMERLSPLVKFSAGVTSLICAPVTAFTTVEPAILYGVVTLVTAAMMSVVFLRLRNEKPVRVAILARRKPSSIIPPVWIALAVVQGLIALMTLEVRTQAPGAIFVCVSTIACAVLAWRVTQMPALLSGDDVVLEEFVDMRLRGNRAASVLYLGFVQTFVFVSQLSALHTSRMTVTAYELSTVLWLAYTIWFMVLFFRKARVTPASA